MFTFQIPIEQFTFKFNKESISENKNGSVSLHMKCPVKNCQEGFVVTRKAYQNYYKIKKSTSKKTQSRISPPRWHLASVQKHVLNDHSSSSDEDEDGDSNRDRPGIDEDENPDDGNPVEDEIENADDNRQTSRGDEIDNGINRNDQQNRRLTNSTSNEPIKEKQSDTRNRRRKKDVNIDISNVLPTKRRRISPKKKE